MEKRFQKILRLIQKYKKKKKNYIFLKDQEKGEVLCLKRCGR